MSHVIDTARVLVTGASGFVGRHCLPLLVDRCREVHAITSNGRAVGSDRVHWHHVDLIRDANGLPNVFECVRPTHLLHLAWFTKHGEFWTSPSNASWYRASQNLIHRFIESGGLRVVTAGTCAEYSWLDGECDESWTPLRPSTVYGRFKHALNMWTRVYANRSGVSHAHTRAFLLYGPGESESRLVPSIARSLLAGVPARCSHGRQLRNLLHVEDVAAAHVELLLSDECGPFNIGATDNVRLSEVAGVLADLCGRPDLLHLGAVPTRAEEPMQLVPCTERVARKLGWRPRWELECGLRHTIDWWRRQECLHVAG